MSDEAVLWIAMACFMEGLGPSALALSARHLLMVEAVISELKAESPPVAYYRCLETLSALPSAEACL